jgi:hypothetical protein
MKWLVALGGFVAMGAAMVLCAWLIVFGWHWPPAFLF